MATVQATKTASGSTASSSRSSRTEEYNASSYSTGGTLREGAQSSRVVYSAPVSVLRNEDVHGAADSVRSTIKIVSEDESSLFGEDAAKFILETREREKRELQGLNDRLAAYLEKMHHLELQNKDMDGLRSRWEKDVVTVKQRYEHQLAESERNLDESAKIKATLEAQIARLANELGDHRKRFDDVSRSRDDHKSRADDLLKQLSSTEAELNLLRRKLQNLEGEVAGLKAENARLLDELRRARADLDAEALKAIEYQNQVQSLLKKIEFLNTEHELEIKQFRGAPTSVISTAEYQNELAAAIRDIRREFDGMAKQNKVDLEAWYRRKVTEIQVTETGRYQDEAKRLGGELQVYSVRISEYEATNSKLKRELADLQMRLESDKRGYETQLTGIHSRYQGTIEENRSLQLKLKALFETNQALYAEIAIYRKLLDGEEGHSYSTRIQEVVKPVESVHIMKEEMVTHTSFQRSNKGNVQFSEVAIDGKFIVLENLNSVKDENLTHWKLTRQLDGSREVVYTFPKFTLKAGKTVKVWAKGQHGSANLTDALIFEGADNWGIGLNVATTLYNREGEEKANYIQTTTTSQRTLEST